MVFVAMERVGMQFINHLLSWSCESFERDNNCCRRLSSGSDILAVKRWAVCIYGNSFYCHGRKFCTTCASAFDSIFGDLA